MMSGIVLTVFLFLSTMATSASAMAGAIAPEPVDAQWWTERHELHLQRARAGGIQVLFLGDSITEGWHGNGKHVWDKNLAPLSASNFGIGGDRVEHVLWRVENGEVDGIAPRVVVVLIGTNNLAYHTVEDISATHVELVKELRRRLPESKLLLLGVFPRVDSWSREFRKNVAPLNQNLSQLADGRDVYYLNFGAKFQSPNGGISKKIMPDGLHLSETGYAIWAREMMPTLRRLLRIKAVQGARQGS